MSKSTITYHSTLPIAHDVSEKQRSGSMTSDLSKNGTKSTENKERLKALCFCKDLASSQYQLPVPFTIFGVRMN